MTRKDLAGVLLDAKAELGYPTILDVLANHLEEDRARPDIEDPREYHIAKDVAALVRLAYSITVRR